MNDLNNRNTFIYVAIAIISFCLGGIAMLTYYNTCQRWKLNEAIINYIDRHGKIKNQKNRTRAASEQKQEN